MTSNYKPNESVSAISASFLALLVLLLTIIIAIIVQHRRDTAPTPAPSATAPCEPLCSGGPFRTDAWDYDQLHSLTEQGYTPLDTDMIRIMEEDRVGRMTELRLDLGRSLTPADLARAGLSERDWSICLMGGDDTMYVACPDGLVIGS